VQADLVDGAPGHWQHLSSAAVTTLVLPLGALEGFEQLDKYRCLRLEALHVAVQDR
jgi:hypothetical protein